jgi:hypothetical protein
MNPTPPNVVPFTEDPTKQQTTDYAEFTETAYTSMFCEHKVTERKMHVTGDGVNTKGNTVRLTCEKADEGEGPIYQKDLYTFCYHHLGKERPDHKTGSVDRREDSGDYREKAESNRRGYWLIEVADHPKETTLPLPVFQFGTLGLEVYPADKGVIKSVHVHLTTQLSHPFGRG